jgi:hypothetical protein
MSITGSKNIKMYVVNENKSNYIFQHLKFEDNELHINTYQLPIEIQFIDCQLVRYKIVFIKETWLNKSKRFFSKLKTKLL